MAPVSAPAWDFRIPRQGDQAAVAPGAYDPDVSLNDAIAKALVASGKLKTSGAANEANTKALMIEPLLAALGWDPTDLDVVEREVKVYDGTFLDYGLKADGASRLYVEAKAIGENVTDKKFVAKRSTTRTTTVSCGAC